jgi:hypothetical protein
MLPQPGDQQAAGASGTSLDLGLQGVLGEMRALVLRRVGLTEEHVAARLQVGRGVGGGEYSGQQTSVAPVR